MSLTNSIGNISINCLMYFYLVHSQNTYLLQTINFCTENRHQIGVSFIHITSPHMIQICYCVLCISFSFAIEEWDLDSRKEKSFYVTSISGQWNGFKWHWTKANGPFIYFIYFFHLFCCCCFCLFEWTMYMDYISILDFYSFDFHALFV